MKAKDSPNFHPALSQRVVTDERLARLAAKLDKRSGRRNERPERTTGRKAGRVG